jgi:hypothetical protein
MFRSYEPGRSDYVTFISNVHGLQDAFGGPNYFALSDDHFFSIKIDNTGDGLEDITLQFYAGNALGGNPYTAPFVEGPNDCVIGTPPETEAFHDGLSVPVNDENGNPVQVQYVPLKFIGPIAAGSNNPGLNWFEWYQMNLVLGNNRSGPEPTTTPLYISGSQPPNGMFTKPFDYAGEKTFGTPDEYEQYARQYIYQFDIPGCLQTGKVFVGQRKEGFNINLGEVFDLVNFVPIEGFIEQNDCNNDLRYSNVNSFVVEFPADCLRGSSSIIGAWTEVNRLCHSGSTHVVGEQVSRLGMPLVNELLIPIANKSYWNLEAPIDDIQFEKYYQYPSFPSILDILFRTAVNSVLEKNYKNIAPFNLPREDLVATFLTGLAGVNQPPNVVKSDQLRLNLDIDVTLMNQQNPLGVIAGDNAGFPNGRRPGDDVVDIGLRVLMGKLCVLGLYCNASQAPVGDIPFTDGAPVNASYFTNYFPYLTTPVSGSPWPGKMCPTPTPSPTPSSSSSSHGLSFVGMVLNLVAVMFPFFN